MDWHAIQANQLDVSFGIEGFNATNGWPERWKQRENIQFKQQHGETQDIDESGAERWIVEVLPDIIKEYDEHDIFNADETGLYWRAIPEGTLTFKHHEAAGNKVPKDRLTLLLACNMDGSEKLPPLVIGKSKEPRCFKNVKKLSVAYEANCNAWMTSEGWLQWLKKLNNSMWSKRQQIVLLCDDCAAQSDDIRLTNIKLVFMPPNTTSLIQPIDQGIIANFKRNYQSLMLRRLMAIMDLGDNETMRAIELAHKLTLLDSLHMQKDAWSHVSTSTIVNCYRQASFVKAVEGDSTIPVPGASAAVVGNSSSVGLQLPDGMPTNDFDRFVEIDSNAATRADKTDEEICESLKASTPAANQLEEEERLDAADVDDVQTAPAMALTFANAVKSLDFIRAYLESTGCDSYKTFYALSSQIYDHRLNQAQTTITDYFRCV
ncbi:tigger transposable element-derived protein 4-like [Erpetoichthys calabaricus]|uniref:tigger transposable element-derived protein 4-like n=1 Tax=Erpetoichthys calabaricus TaxID=27687 RepID=UPI002234D086|nr:tigger transposable element-derived protein 4-like [Erpetoichthys calabaricus]